MTKPNFFIIGSLKCGTTSLADYLFRHPSVYMPGLWETNYLADDLVRNSPPSVRDDDEYLRLFAPGADRVCVGEKSAFYLYSTVAARRIQALSPDARILCMLRDPVDMLWSLYRYNFANLEERLAPFEAALAAEPERRRGAGIEPTVTIVDNLFYRSIVRFATQLERYYAVFPRERILVLLFDELKANPQGVFQRVAEFLGLDAKQAPEARVVNEGERDLSFVEVRRFLVAHPALKRAMERLLPIEGRRAVKRLISVARGGEDPRLRRMAAETRAALCMELRPEVDRLSELLGRDLSHWCRA